ncbi:MAG: cytochrome C oxidase subunit IV family protein [Gammaproteobacteria bacterium]
MATAEGQQHPIKIYLWIWFLLFLFSGFSYATDFMADGPLRITLILSFMLVKAGLIIAIFMHMAWERLALIYAIFLPPVFILVFILLMTIEGDYTFLTREIMFMFPGA